jgi:hypothetical protein
MREYEVYMNCRVAGLDCNLVTRVEAETLSLAADEAERQIEIAIPDAMTFIQGVILLNPNKRV